MLDIAFYDEFYDAMIECDELVGFVYKGIKYSFEKYIIREDLNLIELSYRRYGKNKKLFYSEVIVVDEDNVKRIVDTVLNMPVFEDKKTLKDIMGDIEDWFYN